MIFSGFGKELLLLSLMPVPKRLEPFQVLNRFL